MHMGKLTDMTPRVNFASRAVAEKGERWGPRTIPDWQLFSVVSGEAVLEIGPDRWTVRPGETVFYGPDAPHLLYATERIDFFSLHFSWHEPSPEPVHPAYRIVDHAEGPDGRHSRPEPFAVAAWPAGDIEIPRRFAVPGLHTILNRMVKEYQEEPIGYPFALRALLMELLTVLLRHLTDLGKGALLGKIEPALAAMRDDPARKWTVAELAELCGYHPSYFTSLFHRETGANPKEYLIAERIKRAKALLLRGEPMESIAESLGYGSIHYFSNNFKKETGLSPSEFRQLPTGMPAADGPL